MSWLLDVVNWLLLTAGDAVQWIWHVGFWYLGTWIESLGRALNPLLAPLFRWLNVPVNAAASVLLAPIGFLPGWLSNTLISAVAGGLLLLVFKYTSNQAAIGRVKDDIKANMLALKLYKDELAVVFKAQLRLFAGALKLLRYSLFPLLVMIVPVALLLGQMGLWYQWRPLRPGEEAIVTVQLAGDPTQPLPEVAISAINGADVTIGPVRIPSKREVLWQITARQAGRCRIVFSVDRQSFEKELVIGAGLQKISAARPAWDWTQIILHPWEAPFSADNPVRSITIDYPDRLAWTCGTDWWIAYFFVASMIAALLFKPLLKVKI